MTLVTSNDWRFLHNGCWWRFLLLGNNVLGMMMTFVYCLYHDCSVCGVFACICVSFVRCSLYPLSVLFTGNTQTSHPIAWSPPRRPPHKGTDTCLIISFCIALFVGIASHFKFDGLDSEMLRSFITSIIIPKLFISRCWLAIWPDRSWWLSFLLCTQRCQWVLLQMLATRLERTGPWSVGNTGGQRKTFI